MSIRTSDGFSVITQVTALSAVSAIPTTSKPAQQRRLDVGGDQEIVLHDEDPLAACRLLSAAGHVIACEGKLRLAGRRGLSHSLAQAGRVAVLLVTPHDPCEFDAGARWACGLR